MTPLLKPRDVARLLGVTETTVLGLAKSGKLPSVRFQTWAGKSDRGTVRFTPEAIQQFIEEHTKGGGQ